MSNSNRRQPEREVKFAAKHSDSGKRVQVTMEGYPNSSSWKSTKVRIKFSMALLALVTLVGWLGVSTYALVTGQLFGNIDYTNLPGDWNDTTLTNLTMLASQVISILGSVALSVLNGSDMLGHPMFKGSRVRRAQRGLLKTEMKKQEKERKAALKEAENNLRLENLERGWDARAHVETWDGNLAR